MRRSSPWMLLMVFCARTVGKPQDADYVGGTRYRLRRVYTPDYECDKVTSKFPSSVYASSVYLVGGWPPLCMHLYCGLSK